MDFTRIFKLLKGQVNQLFFSTVKLLGPRHKKAYMDNVFIINFVWEEDVAIPYDSYSVEHATAEYPENQGKFEMMHF